jgi:hypothetical protein
MKINYKEIFLLVIIIMCYSCEKQKSINYFDNTEHITESELFFTDKKAILGRVFNIDVYDSLVILQHNLDEYAFSFIHSVNGELSAKWGSKGHGPNEYVQILGDFDVYRGKLVFLDNTKHINFVPIAEVIHQQTNFNIDREPYPYIADFRPMRIVLMNDSIKIALGGFEKGRFGIFSSHRILNCPYDYPFNYKEIQGIYRGSVFQSRMKTNQLENRFVLSMLSSDIFEIYQLTDTTVERIFISPYKHIPTIWKKGNRYTINYARSVAGITGMAVTENYICFTYSSQSYEEAVQSSLYSNEILFYDWNGNKVKKVILPFSIGRFCLDDNYIYGLRTEGEETCIYRFKMN